MATRSPQKKEFDDFFKRKKFPQKFESMSPFTNKKTIDYLPHDTPQHPHSHALGIIIGKFLISKVHQGNFIMFKV
jgi:hypothetical protein